MVDKTNIWHYFFLQQILNYSRSSTKGEEFLKRLSNITTQATIFVPDNNGLYENEVIIRFLYYNYTMAGFEQQQFQIHLCIASCFYDCI